MSSRTPQYLSSKSTKRTESSEQNIDPKVLEEIFNATENHEIIRPRNRKIVEEYLRVLQNRSARKPTKQQAQKITQNFLRRVAFYKAERDHKLKIMQELENRYDWKNDQLLFYPKIGLFKERDQLLQQTPEDISHEQSIPIPF